MLKELASFIESYGDYLIPIITCLLTLFATWVGSSISRRTEKEAEHRREIIDCYTSFFRTYTDFIADMSKENKGRVICAIEVARLLCSKKAATLFYAFESCFLENAKDIGSHADLLDQIRKQGAADMARKEFKLNCKRTKPVKTVSESS